MHDQIISCPIDFLQAPINSNPRNIALNHYILRRILAIKGSNLLAVKNKYLSPLCKVITLDDMLQHCGLTEYNRSQKQNILKVAEKILNYLVEKNVISYFYFETKKKAKFAPLFLIFDSRK
ncbi:MAG: hypothetical protein IJT73_02770 [Selenomonadaceae bacterium]|nr:hypothetical protein [Selenomonadaceae bacterium]